jgi:hypothetical protein
VNSIATAKTARTLMRESELLAIWARYRIPKNVAALQLAEHLGIIVRAQANGTWVMIPWLASQQQQQQQQQETTSAPSVDQGHLPAGMREHRRTYLLAANVHPSIVRTLFDQLTLSTAALPGAVLQSHSADHLVVKLPSGTIVLLEHSIGARPVRSPGPDPDALCPPSLGLHHPRISFHLRVSDSTPEDVVSSILRSLATIFTSGISSSAVQLFRTTITCPHCLSQKSSPASHDLTPPTEFTAANVANALATSPPEKLQCHFGTSQVAVDAESVAPLSLTRTRA